MFNGHIWILEKKNGKGLWVPHEDYAWFDTKEECRKYSNKDPELRTVKYVRA